MKANELMVGDWVLYHQTHELLSLDKIQPTDKYIRIESIVEEGVNEVYCQGDIDWVGYDEIEPVPLTEEILKANGWTEFHYGHFEDENHRHFTRGFDRRLELSLIKGDNCFCTNFSLGRIDFYFVHELQHALKNCGLNELADKFKVE